MAPGMGLIRKEGTYPESGRLLERDAAHILHSQSEAQVRVRLLFSLRGLSAQISKEGTRNVQSLFAASLESGTLLVWVFRKGFVSLFIKQHRLRSNFLVYWPTFSVPLASLAQQGSLRASSQLPVWE